ncbi:TonB-dependent receptor plug domain-containing protein, partial [Alteromonas sp. AMM-1]|uniref:TonB-dependent receptor plug domain-containing protein n=1 Tax=Alteromonas sp. AMM-1 TaxID=3394233 RepID=UPI0039A71683
MLAVTSITALPRSFRLAVVLSLLVCLPVAATPAELERPVYLKAQPLQQALQSLAITFNRAFIVNAKRIDHLASAELKGHYTLDNALAELLINTGLTYQINDDGIIIKAEQTHQQQKVIEEVAVNGIRASLNRSRQQKQQSSLISDVIAARDIASYPDRNLAESLQRIPGMSITREAGEGRQIVLRGLNPDFTLVKLNGMPVLANNDSPMDSRLQKHRDRSFDMNLFATELFSEIQVIKSYTADQPSGALAGIAALQTAHPFDTPGLRWSFTQQVGTNQYAGGIAPRLSGMLSSTRGNWGALLSVSYGSQQSREVGANTFRWRKTPPDGADISALPTDIQQAWQGQQLWIPRGNRYSVWQSNMQRLGIGASLEYLTHQSHITFDWLYGEFSGERRENHLYPRGYNSTPIIEGQTHVTGAQVNQQNELIYASYQNARVGTESRVQKVATHYQQWVVNTEHRINSLLSGTGTFGVEQASYEMPLSIKAYMRGSSDITVDYRSDYHFPDIAYADDLTTPSFWKMNELDSEKYLARTLFSNARYQLDYTHNAHSEWTLGIDLTHFKNSLNYTNIQDILLAEWTTSSVLNHVPEGSSYILHAHPKLNWLALNPQSVFAYFAVPQSPDAIAFSPFIKPDNQISQNNLIREVQAAGFVQYRWQHKQWELISGLRTEQDLTRIHFSDTPTEYNELSQMNWLP